MSVRSRSNWDLEQRKPEYPEKNLSDQGKDQQQTHPTYGGDTRIRTRATLVGGEWSHHCATLSPSHSFIHLFGLHFTSYILLSIDRTKNEKTGVFLGAVSWCCGNHCWFAFVLWCGYCSVSFQSFVLRHLVITPETDKTCRRHDEHRPLDCVKSSIS